MGKSFARAAQDSGIGVVAFVELDPRKIGQEIHGAPVLGVKDALRIRGPLHAAAVGQYGARARIEGLLDEAGLVVGKDFLAIA